MNRRRFGLHLAIALALATAAASAQPSPARIAWIGPSDAAGQAQYIASFKEGMRDNGMVEGSSYVLDAPYAVGHYDRFPAMIDTTLKRNPALIMAVTIASVRAAQRATDSAPIVFVSTLNKVPLLRNQTPMPSQQGIRGDRGVDFEQGLPSYSLGLPR